ncbi:glycosyltransferase family 2 protein [Sutcliffiella horikoshii]|uniref:glycosyltransferase family 2 protein n=1 Tax=Sutcliffiella horikoshii TaxID=79883 RepID=UPI001CC1AC77|nr:glycosyltransferase family 2 protein [Sutcliffiella horikoshii]UAL46939.1 glycosyltransferase family 2 protein [Sutcliffiella horikoshii]
MKLLTVFTPTYNRSYCLGRCYESLKNQTSNIFTWLIIDDGSTDGTKELVDRWKNENKIDIEYIWQENQGMHGAHNTAYEHITTELNVCIDSDDYMPIDAVEKIVTFWKEHGSEKVSGIVGLDLFTNGQVIGTLLPKEYKTSTLFNLYNKHGVKGDKKLVYRTELTKRYPYPIFTGEKYVGLAYKYFKLDQDYELLIMNEALCVVEYLPDGSSVNMLNQYRMNPKGFAFYRKELMKLPFVSFMFKVRQAVHYVSSSLMMNNRKFISEAPNKRITTLVLPFGYLLYLYIITKTKVA